MPTYEYKCKTCGYHFERVQRFSDAPITECPECGNEVRKVIHPAGVIFKGAGWYITDSRKGGGESATLAANNGAKAEGDGAKADTAAPAAEATKSESSATEKPAAAKAES